MPKTGKERQREYKEKLKTSGKKAVLVHLSKKIYDILKGEKARSGKNFSEIMDTALSSVYMIDNIPRDENWDMEEDRNKIRDQLKDLTDKRTNEWESFIQETLYEVDKPTKRNKGLSDDEKRYREILEHSFDDIIRLNLDSDKFEYVSLSGRKGWPISAHEMLSLDSKERLFAVHPEDREKLQKEIDDAVLCREQKGRIVEYRAKLKGSKKYRWRALAFTVKYDDNKHAVAIIGNVRDVTKYKRAEKKLLRLIDQRDRKLMKYSINLNEKNTALKVLLKQNQEEKAAMEEKVLFNMKELVLPVMEKLKHCKIDEIQKYMDNLESNLYQITSSFSSKVTSRYLNFSHQELQVSNYVLHGKTTKEIAELMGLSERTIDFHRAKIRKKLSLTNKKENLRTHLLSLQ